nr:hypothetical protein [Tanacetum cinerariifolium]
MICVRLHGSALLSTRMGEFNPNRAIHSICAPLTGPPIKKLTVHDRGTSWQYGNLGKLRKQGNSHVKDGDDGGKVVVVVCVRCDDDDDGVVGIAAVGGRDGGVEVRRVAVEGGDEVLPWMVFMITAAVDGSGDKGGMMASVNPLSFLTCQALADIGGDDCFYVGPLVALLSTQMGEFNPNRAIHSIRAPSTGPPIKKLTFHDRGTSWQYGNLSKLRKQGNSHVKDGDDGGRVVVVVCVGCDDDDDGVVGVAAVGGRNGGVEVRRVAVEGGDEGGSDGDDVVVVVAGGVVGVRLLTEAWPKSGRKKGAAPEIWSCDDDDGGVVGVTAVGGRDGGVEVRRVAVEGGDEVVSWMVLMITAAVDGSGDEGGMYMMMMMMMMVVVA